MMSEIKEIESIINPTEVMLVADSLTGQVAANVAKEFKSTVNLTGIILTRSDGDGRGGAALSMKYVADVPIKFLGVGEKIENFEVFYPDRIANRLLGMGDIVSLVEKASEDLDQENLKKTEEEFLNNEVRNIEDFQLINTVRSIFMKNYIREIVNNNRDLEDKRIFVENIHTIKGKEFDNVVLDLTLTRTEDNFSKKRMKYVACSRAKKTLWLVKSKTNLTLEGEEDKHDT